MILSTFCYQNKKLDLHYYEKKSLVKYGIVFSSPHNSLMEISYRGNLRAASLRYAEMITELVL